MTELAVVLIVGVLILLGSAEALANLRYRHCPRCGYSGQQKHFDVVTDPRAGD